MSTWMRHHLPLLNRIPLTPNLNQLDRLPPPPQSSMEVFSPSPSFPRPCTPIPIADRVEAVLARLAFNHPDSAPPTCPATQMRLLSQLWRHLQTSPWGTMAPGPREPMHFQAWHGKSLKFAHLRHPIHPSRVVQHFVIIRKTGVLTMRTFLHGTMKDLLLSVVT